MVIMADNAPTLERRKLVKTYKNVLHRKRIVIAEVSGETYCKSDKKKWSRTTATNINKKHSENTDTSTSVTFDM